MKHGNKTYTGYMINDEKIYDGDVLIIHQWCETPAIPNTNTGVYDHETEWRVSLSEYDTEEPRGDIVIHCGWNANGIPLPHLANNKFLLDGNSYTKCLGIKK